MADFFTTEIWSPVGLVRYNVFFVMKLATRKVEIAGIKHEPHGEWMQQIARNLTDSVDGSGKKINTWYDLALLIRTFHALVDVLGEGDASIAEAGGRHTAQRDLTGAQRFFLKMANPAYVIEKASSYWSW